VTTDSAIWIIWRPDIRHLRQQAFIIQLVIFSGVYTGKFLHPPWKKNKKRERNGPM
jgi:hypothetical protein